MSIFGGLLVSIGIFVGMLAVVGDDSGFACVSSIAAMTVGMLLFQYAQRRTHKAT